MWESNFFNEELGSIIMCVRKKSFTYYYQIHYFMYMVYPKKTIFIFIYLKKYFIFIRERKGER